MFPPSPIRGLTSSNAFDALGRVVQATNTDGGIEAHSYNKRDETVPHKDPVNVISAFVRNGSGDMIQEVSPHWWNQHLYI